MTLLKCWKGNSLLTFNSRGRNKDVFKEAKIDSLYSQKISTTKKKKKKYVAQICQTKNLPKEIQTSEKGTSLRYIRPLNNSGARGATLLHNWTFM